MNKKDFLKKIKIAAIALTCGSSFLTGCSTNEKVQKLQEKFSVSKLSSSQGVDFYAFNTLSNEKANELIQQENLPDNYINFFNEYDYDVLCTPSEFESYLNYGQLGWEDIKRSVNENANIEDYLKQYILEGINNLEIRNFKISLPTLYYNLSNLKTDYLEDDRNNGLTVITASFNPLAQTVYINKDITGDQEVFKRTFLQEVLGHGATCARYTTLDGRKINCSLDIPVCILENGEIRTFSFMGKCMSEAAAEIIRSAAIAKRIENFDTSYTFNTYSLLFLCNGMDISVNDVFLKGTKVLFDKSREKNIQTPVDFIYNLDLFNMAYFQARINNYPFNVKDFYITYLKDYIESQKIMGLSTEEIKAKTNNMLYNYESYLIPSGTPEGYKCFYAAPYETKQIIIPEIIDSEVYNTKKMN